MSASMNGANQYVPWSVYLQDKREQAEAMRRLEGKVDKLTETVHGIAVELAKDDATEIATEAAAEGVKQARRTFSERAWEVVKQAWAAVLALFIYWLIGGPNQ